MKLANVFLSFLKDIYRSKKLILDLVKNDFKQKYLGSYFGLFWAFVQPVTMICVLWFVFEVGFKSSAVSNVPFILWLSSGMIVWFFFSDGLNSAMNSVVANSFLVKKVVFRVSILPVVNIISALYIHVFFVFFLMFMFVLYGFSPSVYWLQLPYYTLCLIVLLLGFSWLTSSLNVFFKDISPIIGIFLQFGFWLTPIFWQISMVPQKYQWIIKLNPVYYIVQGYRNSFIDNIWFWQNYAVTQYFIVSAGFVFVFGGLVFKRLRPHFADVL